MDISTDPRDIPTHEDGTPYAVALATPDATIGADTYDELLAQLIPDYPAAQTTEEDVARADALRFAYLAQEADHLQAMAVEQAAAAGFLGSDATDEVKWLLSAPRTGHIAVPGGSWEITQLPLVLLTTNYEPFSAEPAPVGAGILWLDPTDARTYITSLAAATGLRVFESAQADGDSVPEQD